MEKVQRLFSKLCITFFLILAGCGGSPSDAGDGDEDPPTEDTTSPSAPGGVAGESGDQQVILIWDAVSADDLDGYNVYRSEESFSEVSGMDPVNESLVSDAEFSDENLQNGITYYYRITAMDENDNESEPSSEIEVTPFSDPPNRP